MHTYDLTEQIRKAETTKDGEAILIEALIDEWRPLLMATISWSCSPALFNPKGLDITTSRTKELTHLLRQYAQKRIDELKGDL
jgi:hypothetical protein